MMYVYKAVGLEQVFSRFGGLGLDRPGLGLGLGLDGPGLGLGLASANL